MDWGSLAATALGGVLAIVAGFGATWLQARAASEAAIRARSATAAAELTDLLGKLVDTATDHFHDVIGDDQLEIIDPFFDDRSIRAIMFRLRARIHDLADAEIRERLERLIDALLCMGSVHMSRLYGPPTKVVRSVAEEGVRLLGASQRGEQPLPASGQELELRQTVEIIDEFRAERSRRRDESTGG